MFSTQMASTVFSFGIRMFQQESPFGGPEFNSQALKQTNKKKGKKKVSEKGTEKNEMPGIYFINTQGKNTIP